MATESEETPASREGAMLSFLESNKQLIIGATALVVVVVGLVIFLSRQSRASEESAWRTFEELQGPTTTVEELRSKKGEFEGTDVEPWFLFHLAKREYADENFQSAIDLIAKIESDFPDHYVVRSVGEDSATKITAGLMQDFKEQLDWTANHKEVKDNPDPSETVVVFKTSAGDIEIGLYLEEAPENCRAILSLLPAYEGLAFKTLGGRGLIGGEAVEEAISLVEHIGATWPDEFPKVEESALYHFQDAVSFRVPINANDKPNGSILFCLDDNFGEDGRQTVFGKVLKGINLLQTASEGERDPENPSNLLSPVMIDSVEARGVPESMNLEELQSATKAWIAGRAKVDAKEVEGDSSNEDG